MLGIWAIKPRLIYPSSVHRQLSMQHDPHPATFCIPHSRARVFACNGIMIGWKGNLECFNYIYIRALLYADVCK